MRTRLPFVFIIMTVAIDSIGIGLILPVMPDLIRSLGLGSISEAADWGGRLALLYALMQFLCGPLLGNLSDRFGRRPVLLISLVAMGIDYVIMALAPTLWVLFIARFIAGIAGATYSTAAAYLADISPPEKRAANFGLIGASFGVGFIMGPAIGGVLGELGPRAPFVAAAILAFANALLGYFVLSETLPASKRRTFQWSRANPFSALARVGDIPLVGRLLGVDFVQMISGHVYPAVWAYFTIERFGWTSATVGLSLAAYGLCSGIVQGALIRPILASVGERRTAIIGLISAICGATILSFASWPPLVFIFMPVFALSAVSDPALRGMMANRVRDDEQGELQGVVSGVAAIAMIISIPLMTQLFSRFTAETAPVYFPGAPFLVAALLASVSLALLLMTPRQDRL